MKLPERPPPFSRLLARYKALRAIEIFRRAGDAGDRAAPGDRYRHWDTLRHLTPPDGMSSEDWWFAIKTTRMSQLRSLPLVDSKREPFQYGLPDVALELLHEIDRNASGHIRGCRAGELWFYHRDRIEILGLAGDSYLPLSGSRLLPTLDVAALAAYAAANWKSQDIRPFVTALRAKGPAK